MSNSEKKVVSQSELRERLADSLSVDEIEDLIDRFAEASLEELPDMAAITDLAHKRREDRLLGVRLKLEREEYDALVDYFGEGELQATLLVKKAIEEFIRHIVA